MQYINIYTDGACSHNPGPGGWAAIIVLTDNFEQELETRIMIGGEANTTNNRMEITGIIQALSSLTEPSTVKITTDSKYVTDTFNKGWIHNWRNNNWIKSDKKPVLNRDLWEQLLEAIGDHVVTFNWIRGHAGHKYNEHCDQLAVKYYKENF